MVLRKYHMRLRFMLEITASANRETPHNETGSEALRYQRIINFDTGRSLDIMPERAYDDITDLAAMICETSIALVSLIDDGQPAFPRG